MSDVLTLSLRPKSLEDMIGQESIAAAIRSQLGQGRLAKTWMFEGDSRSGKTTLARILAVALNKPNDNGAAFGALTEQDWIDAGWNGKSFNRIDVIEHNASNINGVEGIRDLVAGTRFMPMLSRFRVIILDEAQRLTKEAQNCLLKPTEDSTVNIWMICTTEPDKIIEALRLRAKPASFKMKPLDQQGVLNLLNWAIPQISPVPTIDPAAYQIFVQALYGAGVTAPGVVIGSLEQFLAGKSIGEAVTGYVDEVEGKFISQAVLGGNWTPIQKFLKDASLDQIRGLRYQLLGYMRKVALGGGDTARRAADICLFLAENAPYDDIPLAAWMTGKLVKLCTPAVAPAYQQQPHRPYDNAAPIV
jgi:hypothetical protein